MSAEAYTNGYVDGGDDEREEIVKWIRDVAKAARDDNLMGNGERIATSWELAAEKIEQGEHHAHVSMLARRWPQTLEEKLEAAIFAGVDLPWSDDGGKR